MSVNLDEIVSFTGAELAGSIDASRILISSIKPLEEADKHDLAFFAPTSKKMVRDLTDKLKSTRAGAVVLKEPVSEISTPQIISADPLMTVMQVAARWFASPSPKPGISPKADVDASAVLGEGVYVGPFAVIGAGAVIGANTAVHPHVVIYPGAKIGSNCVVHAGAVIRENAVLGDDCLIQSGVVIGGDGFGYKRAKDGSQQRIPHIGRVVLGDGVDFGANSTIDKGMLGDTTIGNQTKIDNLVQVGHNVKMGSSGIVCSQVGVSGSCTIGDNVVLGGQVGIADHISIASGTMAAARTGIVQNTEEGSKIAGLPATSAIHWKRLHAINLELPRIIKQLKKKNVIS